jgi:hypothetical protein
MCSALGSDTLNVMGSDPPVRISTSPEVRYQSNTSATPSLRSATKPSSDIDMIATTFVIRFSSSRAVPMTTCCLLHEQRHADTTFIRARKRLSDLAVARRHRRITGITQRTWAFWSAGYAGNFAGPPDGTSRVSGFAPCCGAHGRRRCYQWRGHRMFVGLRRDVIRVAESTVERISR